MERIRAEQDSCCVENITNTSLVVIEECPVLLYY